MYKSFNKFNDSGKNDSDINNEKRKNNDNIGYNGENFTLEENG